MPCEPMFQACQRGRGPADRSGQNILPVSSTFIVSVPLPTMISGPGCRWCYRAALVQRCPDVDRIGAGAGVGRGGGRAEVGLWMLKVSLPEPKLMFKNSRPV